jgi:hypothetical protein
MNLTSLTVAQLKEAIAIKEKIEALERELESILGTTAEVPLPVLEKPVAASGRRKKKMSPAAKAKISTAQKARWAKAKRKQKPEVKPAIVATAIKATSAMRSPVKPATKAKAKGGKPAVTKEGMIELLKNAGKDGLSAKAVASKLGVKSQRMYVWFSGPGKKVKQIKKIAPGKYAWVD